MQPASQQTLRFSPYLSSLYLASRGGADGDNPLGEGGKHLADGEDLPYRVDVWDQAGLVVEQTLAMTSNGSIGYAAYYAATREFPNHYVTLRHKDRIVARWNVPGN